MTNVVKPKTTPAGTLDNTKPTDMATASSTAPSPPSIPPGARCPVGSNLALDSKALMEALPDQLGQVSGGRIPLASCNQGLLVELHDLGHLVVQAIV